RHRVAIWRERHKPVLRPRELRSRTPARSPVDTPRDHHQPHGRPERRAEYPWQLVLGEMDFNDKDDDAWITEGVFYFSGCPWPPSGGQLSPFRVKDDPRKAASD